MKSNVIKTNFEGNTLTLFENNTEFTKATLFKAHPFVKWAGGKRSLLQNIESLMPKKFNNYFEPFVGGGALFFSLFNKNYLKKNCTISDINIELLITYSVIQNQVNNLIDKLEIHKNNHNEDYYYEIRKTNPSEPVEAAARFIYLNRTCYNGLYRVNNKGDFNTPIGNYEKPQILNKENLLAVHKALQNTNIQYGNFDTIQPNTGDFIYFDPPYHPNDEISFTKYTQENFTEKDQVKLYKFINSLNDKKVQIMLSNSNTNFINDLYKSRKYKKTIVKAPRTVNCKPSKRNKVEELIITNY